MFDGVLVFIGVVTAVVLWLRWNNSYWKKKGIPYVEPTIIFGNMKELITGNTSLGVIYEQIYKAYPDEPAVGLFNMRSPVLMIKDMEMVKQVLVSDFASFRDNGKHISKAADPILGRNPFFQIGDEWKETRKSHTHNHTAAKLKVLFGYVEEVKNDMINHINNNLGKEFDANDFCARFTTDIVSSCIFGIKTNSLIDGESQFRKCSLKLLAMNWKFTLYGVAPSLINFFKIAILPKDCRDYFYNLVQEMIVLRTKNNLKRPDFLQNLLSDKTEGFALPLLTGSVTGARAVAEVARSQYRRTDRVAIDRPRDRALVLDSKLRYHSVMDITAQTMTFFIDGYFTSATEMSFLLYMIAIHPDVQDRLRQEVNSADRLDYDSIHHLSYLEAVFNETLRLYPAGGVLTRVCNQDTTIKSAKRTFEIKTGDNVAIPVYSIHRDPVNFPDPLTFDPERFIKEPNNPALLAFGAGPRACFGSRFAKTQIKTGIVHLVKNFRIAPGTDDLSLPTVNNNKSLLISSDKDMSVKFYKL